VRPPPNERSSIELVTIAGHAPQQADEASIGPATARLLHLEIGDTVAIGSENARVRIVGKALFPWDVHSTFDEGLWLTPATFERAMPLDDTGEPNAAAVVVVRFRDGVDSEAATRRLERELGDHVAGGEGVSVPPELVNLRNVRRLPTVLAGFLALLAIAALGHVLATSVRRRRQEFAVLRALGVTRRGVRLILGAQASAISLAGIMLGIPLGLAVGRIGWQAVADQVPLLYVSPFGVLAIAAVVPVAIVVANLLAVWPGRRAARLRPADVLRAE
jgi:ABC-type lipoprotein release transport system permease subunit